MELKIYNSMTKRKETFKPIDPSSVKMYACGLTPQNHPHLGHAVAAIRFSFIRKYLEFLGYRVLFVENITDIDDKIITRAVELNSTPELVSNTYIKEYLDCKHQLEIPVPSFQPRVSQFIDKIIQYVNQLIKGGYAYHTKEGDVYFEVAKFERYGQLSGRKADDAMSGMRIIPEANKKNELDFALWKHDDNVDASWESPWGRGRPGWHIECSVMSNEILGETIDIHCGGLDLLFPHHENELAQCEAHNHKVFVNYWLHCGLLNVQGKKMSKSLGNFFTINEALDKYGKELITFIILKHHYRSPIDFNDHLFKENMNSLRQFYTVLTEEYLAESLIPEYETTDSTALKQEFNAAMSDDFNTPVAITVLSKYLKKVLEIREDGHTTEALEKTIIKLGRILNILNNTYNPDRIEAELLHYHLISFNKKDGITVGEIKTIISSITEARSHGDYMRADLLRNKLSIFGIKILYNVKNQCFWQFEVRTG